MEYMGNGSLAEYLKRNGAVRESEALHYIYQLADALKFIHQHQMNHLDIKPGNVLLDNNNNATLIDLDYPNAMTVKGIKPVQPL